MLRRHQLPAHSPLPFRALSGALRAKLGGVGHVEQEFRVALRRQYDPQELIFTDSGTTALRLAMAGSTRQGAPVAVPAYGCYDIATAADGANVPVLVYDVDPATLSPNLESLRRALQAGAGAVVVAHLFGVPVRIAEVRRLVEEAGALLIEDAAQAVGASVEGRPVGTFGSLAVLSFGRGKGATAGGGGALLANDQAGRAAMDAATGAGLAAGRFPWSRFGTVAAQWLFGRPSLYGIPSAIPMLRLGETVYHDPRPPTGLAMPGFALLTMTWPLAARESATRRRHAARLLGQVAGRCGIQPVCGPERAEPGYLRLPVVLSPELRQLAGEPEPRRLGIMPGYPRTLPDLERFRPRCANGDARFPGARILATCLVTLPTHGRLSDKDLWEVERWIDSVTEPPAVRTRSRTAA